MSKQQIICLIGAIILFILAAVAAWAQSSTHIITAADFENGIYIPHEDPVIPPPPYFRTIYTVRENDTIWIYYPDGSYDIIIDSTYRPR
jgi:hypothetical protein